LKAERAYAEKDYSKALKYYSQLPNDFPQIRAIMNNKLRYCCDQVNNYLEMGTYMKELIKFYDISLKISTSSSIRFMIFNFKKQLLNDLKNISDYILMEKGIQCKFCQSYISPNANFCPKCGEPVKK